MWVALAVTLRTAWDCGGRRDFAGAETVVFRRFSCWLSGHPALFAGVPCGALLEVTANAIIHRNTGLAGPVLVKAFTTRVEVVSLGGLNGLSPDDLLNGVSLPMNPPLFNRFVAQGFAHGTGGGLARVMECYEGTGVAATVSATTNSVRLILPRIAPASGDGRIIRFPEACRARPTLSMSEGRAF